ncbi:MAG: 6-phosphogluconolactonase [Spirochaetaceae bacterium]|jgi:6-phosphogluconolactonase|nr:6-phosphogluconolactonase [Spirochaetaceae bacterium]
MFKRIYETKKLTAEALAEEIFQKFQAMEREIYIALSGGSTPALLFSILAENYSKSIRFDKINLLWVDERSVSPEDDESNYKMTSRSLLDFINIPHSNIHRVHGENNTEQEAIRYSQIIKNKVPVENNLPVFDIILLGVGDDGHTASIFPDQMELLKSNKICEKAVHPQSGQERVTLTGPVLNNGESVYFLVCGKSKSDIIVKILNKDKSYPASYIENKKGNLFFYLDADASANIE